MKDRRKYLRFSTSIPVDCRRTEEMDGFSESTIKDVSSGGLRVTAGISYPTGTILVFDLKLPGKDDTIGAFGEVVWSRKLDGNSSVSGVRFVNIKFYEKEELLNFAFKNLLKNQ